MKDNTKDLYEYKLINRKIGGKGENLYKLTEYFGVEDNIQETTGYTEYSQLQVGSVSYNLYHHIINILSTKFKIEGLPEHLKVKNFWKYFISGEMIFFKHKLDGQPKKVLVFSQYTPITYDIFYDPIEVQPIFPNETGNDTTLDRTLSFAKDEYVEVLFNPQRKSLLMMIGRFLSDLQWYYDEMKFDTVVSRPIIYINGESHDDNTADGLNSQMSKRGLFKQLTQQGNSNDDELNRLQTKLTSELNQKMEVLQGKSRVQDIIIPAMDIINNYLFEILSLNRNDNKDKKERMIVDEVNINNETKRFATTTIIESMQKSFDEVNRLFGTNITVIDTEQELQDEQDEKVENKQEENKDE